MCGVAPLVGGIFDTHNPAQEHDLKFTDTRDDVGYFEDEPADLCYDINPADSSFDNQPANSSLGAHDVEIQLKEECGDSHDGEIDLNDNKPADSSFDNQPANYSSLTADDVNIQLKAECGDLRDGETDLKEVDQLMSTIRGYLSGDLQYNVIATTKETLKTMVAHVSATAINGSPEPLTHMMITSEPID